MPLVSDYRLWGFAVAMTRERWDSLPGDVQLIMEQLNKEAQFEWFSRYYISLRSIVLSLRKPGLRCATSLRRKGTVEKGDPTTGRWAGGKI